MTHEELKFKVVCLYCKTNFLAYRSNAKFDNVNCKHRYYYENNSAHRERRKKAHRAYSKELTLKRRQKKRSFLLKLLEEYRERKKLRKGDPI